MMRRFQSLVLAFAISSWTLAGPAFAQQQDESWTDWGAERSVDGREIRAQDDERFPKPARGAGPTTTMSDIEISYEAISISPILNTSAGVDPRIAVVGEQVDIVAQWNYSPWVSYGEIRVFKALQNYYDTPLEVLRVGDNLTSTWVPDELGDYFFILRVYDGKGHFDETIPKTIRVVKSHSPAALRTMEDDAFKPLDQIYGADYTRMRSIPLYGGMVTVHGKRVREGVSVLVFGREIPVDDNGEFVAQEIYPPGTHDIIIEYREGGYIARQLTREVTIEEAQWSYVFLGDLVLGENMSSGPANLGQAFEPQFDDIYVNGRAALYINGRFNDKYKLTARVDTGYEAVKDLIRNIDEKDPQYLFRRLDPGEYYPVYADQSTVMNMTPSQGKIYFKLENGDSYFLWGNYATGLSDTEFAPIERGLYGAKIDLVGVNTTRFGERKVRFQAFGAEPGTLPAREEFRGTGGSAYFLRHQDLTIGSERLQVEVRDRETNLVKKTINLRPREDYDIDYIQGRILLNHPLSSYSANDHFVRTGTRSGDTVYLVTHYEYTPTISEFRGWSVGGRASAWMTDHLQVGVTGYNENSAGRDQQQYSADMILRRSPSTYIRGDFVETLGTGFGAYSSRDGGFSFDDLAAGLAPDKASGWRVEASVDGVDVGLKQDEFRMTGFFEHRDPFLSAPGRFAAESTDIWGSNLNMSLTDTTLVRISYAETQILEAPLNRDLTFDLEQEMGRGFKVGLGYRDTHQVRTTLLGTSVQDRKDAALQLEYDPGGLWNAYVFGQAALSEDHSKAFESERVGLGAKVMVAERFELGGEASGGEGGLGGQVNANIRRGDSSTAYFAYQIDPDRTDIGSSDIGPFGIANEVMTIGSKLRFSDSVSLYGEEHYQSGDSSVGILHTYGLDLTPGEHWRLSGAIETGEIEFEDDSTLDRDALSLTAGYNSDHLTFVSNFEARKEEAPLDSRDTYISRTLIDINSFEDWRVTGRVNLMTSDSSKGEFFDGEFTDITFGYGYRPADNDRLNLLLKYTYFKDLPGSEQITASGLTADYKQRSQIFLGDINYDLTRRLTLGLKYGIRIGEITSSRTTDDFIDSVAQLGVVRLDWHVVRQWDFLAEQRILHTDENDTARSGSVFALYRHFGDHFKLGIGYNFADFSERLTNVSFDDEGAFLNVVAKY